MPRTTEQDLTDAIVRIQDTMEEAEPEKIDHLLLDYMAAGLRGTADKVAALEWAEGFDTYLRAA